MFQVFIQKQKSDGDKGAAMTIVMMEVLYNNSSICD